MNGVFLDTNVLLYSISRSPCELAKREHAIALLDRDDCALSVQVLQEFYVQATRPSRSNPLPHETAVGLIRAWGRFRVQETTTAVLYAAFEIKARYGFSYWDAALIAAARAMGCATLYTEDLSHGQIIEDLSIVDPFRV